MPVYQLGEMVSLVFMAFALGMDAFSISLGMGMQQIRLKRIAIAGLVVGFFHTVMPFTGIVLGSFISTQIGHYAELSGGLLLVAIGAQMIFSAFNYETKKLVQPVGLGLIFFAFSVSLDSFSVGLSLGLSNGKTVIALILFAAASTFLTWAGMLMGKKVYGLLGAYSEILGGSILVGFGLHILFS
ncbi:manganese efflux pump MntP family protein [Barrientosiimonas marina]|uniref:Putative manganese efflux pump MntP n=1 Tax=Lentibacillus kimchii TaxID=1542911 RepID=A0ABW2UX85_9BACI